MRLKALLSFHLSYLVILLILIFNCSAVKHQANSVTADFHYNRGLEFLKLNDPENAERAFRFAIELDNHFAPAHLGLAILNYNEEDYSASEHHVDEAIKYKNHWVDAYILKGKIFFQKQEYEKSIELFNQAENVVTNGNGNKRKSIQSEIFLWRGLCLKNLGNHEMSAIELAAALKLDPDNLPALEALNEIRLISDMTAVYPESVKNIFNKKLISRADWAALLLSGLSKKYISGTPDQSAEKKFTLPDAGSGDIITKAVQKKLVNVYPDGEFKPDLDLSWAEVIISVKHILPSSLTNKKSARMFNPPFSDLPELHPLYFSAALAESLGIFKNLSQKSFLLSQPVKGIDALHVIVNLNRAIE